MKPTFQIEGLQEAIRAVHSIRSALEAKDVENVLLKGARLIQQDMRRRVKVKTGRLKRAIRVKKAKRRGRWNPSAFAAVDRKKAPHAHLVENGTSRAPAHPFARPAAEAMQEPVAREVTEGLRDLVAKGAGRR